MYEPTYYWYHVVSSVQGCTHVTHTVWYTPRCTYLCVPVYFHAFVPSCLHTSSNSTITIHRYFLSSKYHSRRRITFVHRPIELK